MKKLVVLSLIVVGVFFARSIYAYEAYYYEICPGCGGNEHRDVTIPEPKPSFEDGRRPEDGRRNCHTEEYVCGQTCWDGSYDGDRSRQGMGYCIDKICSKTVCE